MNKLLSTSTALLPIGLFAVAFPALSQQTGSAAPSPGSELYQAWAGEDGVLTAVEWDAGVDARFGEQGIDLDVTDWDRNADGVISHEEFQGAAAQDPVFQAAIQSAQASATGGSDQASPAGDASTTTVPTEDLARTLKNHHADLASPITLSNVGQLTQSWSIESDNPISHVPLVSGDRVYFADWGGAVYAADAKTGEVLWQKKVEEPMMAWPWHGFAGTGAIGEGLLFQASTEGNAFALDAETGEVRWQTQVAEDEEAGSISKLTYWEGLVFIGLQSVEEPMTAMKEGFKPDFRGKVLALDAKTGEQVWQTQLVEAPHNGVAMWSSFALDPETGVLYFTTGNNYTGEATPLSDSIVAVDARSGEILWSQQTTQHDVWTVAEPKGPDYDFAGGPQLFEASIDGESRKLVGAGQKSGIFYAWDAETGEPAWSTSIGYGGVEGGMLGEASIGSDRIIAWSNNNYQHKQPPENHHASIKALEPATGRHVWVNDKAQPPELFAAGFLASDVYFLGSLDSKLRAYSAQDGKEVWSTNAPGPIITSVWADGSRVFVSTGAPKLFGDWAKGKNTVTAYSLPQ